MNPSSSNSEAGFANSARRSAVICGDVDDGMRERSSREEGSRDILGLWRVPWGIRDFGVVVLFLDWTGRGALPPSGSPMQQNSAMLLLGFGRFCFGR